MPRGHVFAGMAWCVVSPQLLLVLFPMQDVLNVFVRWALNIRGRHRAPVFLNARKYALFGTGPDVCRKRVLEISIVIQLRGRGMENVSVFLVLIGTGFSAFHIVPHFVKLGMGPHVHRQYAPFRICIVIPMMVNASARHRTPVGTGAHA
jgi:hypothetical protein